MFDSDMEEIFNYGYRITYIQIDILEISSSRVARIYASLVCGIRKYFSSVWSRGSYVLSSSFLWVRFFCKKILNNGCLNHPHAHINLFELTYLESQALVLARNFPSFIYAIRKWIEFCAVMCLLSYKVNILWLGSCEHFLNTCTYKFVRIALLEFSSSCVARYTCHLSLWHTKRIKGYVSSAFSVSFKLTIFAGRLLQDLTLH